MKTEQLKVRVSDSVGEVSAEIVHAGEARYVMTLAHGAGAGMNHIFLQKLSAELALQGITTVRFNFPYMEKGSKRPDVPAIAQRAVQSVIEKTIALFPGLPIIAAGKSFGGRMTSQLLCKHTFTEVKGIIFYGFPLHPMGNPGVERAAHLSDIKIPMLFLQGTKDALALQPLIESVCRQLLNATLIFIEKADHSFKVGKKDSIVDLSTKSSDWLDNLKIT
jgi:uncharacterized protein